MKLHTNNPLSTIDIIPAIKINFFVLLFNDGKTFFFNK